MWNSNSRRWLVKDSEDAVTSNYTNINPTIATIAHKTGHHTKRKCRSNATSSVEKLITAHRASEMATAAAATKTKTRGLSLPLRVNPCLNQIIEVLLAILLTNCLTQLPTATAAFGGVSTVDDEAPSIYRGSSSSDGSRQYGNYRQPYSIGSGGGINAFGYNSLSLPQEAHSIEDFQSAALAANQLPRSQNFKISPKPCSIGRIEGTCMFVWECIKSEGRHVGMCVDSFMFGSCCAHNNTDNFVLPQPFSYTRPTKPVGISSLNHRPPHFPHRPSISGMTTIERPHGAGTLVIRPSGPHHQGALHRPQYTKPSTTTTTTVAASTLHPSSTSTTTASKTSSTEDPSLFWTSNAVLSDMQSAASIPSSSSNMWHSSAPHTASTQQQQHWHMTTEPNFITKPRPPSWEKPTPSHRPKPSKPTKKPITSERPALHQQQQQQQHHHQQQYTPPAIVYPTRRPLPSSTKPWTETKPQRPQQQPQYTKPTREPTTTRPYSRPTPSWSSTSESGRPSSSSTQPISSMRPSSSTTTTTEKTTTKTTTTTQKYKPTTTLSSSSSPSTSSSSSPTKTTQRPSKPSHASPTLQQRPTISSSSTTSAASSSSSSSLASSSSSTLTTSVAAFGSSTFSQTLPPHNLTTIESNEITDTAHSSSSSSMATIKTISAARSECGVPVLARPETRIVGGKSAPFGRWPWQVSVRRTSFFGFSSTHRCGGALINENWIATAGHCVDDLLISQIRIRVGEYDFSHVQEQLPYIERGVAKKVVHPKYNFFTYEYDLALVKLEQPLEFAPHVSPICLPQTDSLMIGMNATVTGWGRLSEGGTLPSVLQEVSVPIVSNDNCKTMFLRAGRQEFIPEIFLCAGYEGGGQDSCQGDSGGPLQVKSQDGRFFLAGIISWGIGCAEANLPGVCTRISKFVPWIMENVT